MRLLIAEDDPRLLKSLVYIFEHNNYSVDGVGNGNDAYDYAKSGEYDGLVLDVMMPGMDGFTLLSQLRKEGLTTPALFLTARAEVEERVEGLDLGADDYLTKPFQTAELLARVRAMLRRRDAFHPEQIIFCGVSLCQKTFVLSYNGLSHTLSTREFQVLELLMQKAKMIVPTEEFMMHIWGWDTDVDTSVVWVHISNIRKKMESLLAPVQIRFVRGAGYVLEEKQ